MSILCRDGISNVNALQRWETTYTCSAEVGYYVCVPCRGWTSCVHALQGLDITEYVDNMIVTRTG